VIRSIRLRAVAVSAALALTGNGLAPVQTVAGAVPLPLYRIDAIVPMGVATAINELGDFVGWQSLTGSPRAFIHRGGQLTLLPTPSDRPLSVARDLNDAGAVVGYAYKTTIDEPGDAMRWTPGTSGWTFKDLGFLPGDLVSEADGINEHGQIVGRSNPRSFLQEHAFLYADAAGMSQINAVSNTFVAEDINELGVVVGTGYSTAQRVDVTTGVARDLGVLSPYGYSHAYAVNDAGQVAGALTSATGSSQRVARYAEDGPDHRRADERLHHAAARGVCEVHHGAWRQAVRHAYAAVVRG
jgi:probable HAF family extracellular repeat protein